MSKLFDFSSLAMIPSAYKDGKLYSIRPTDGSGDFTFSRGSNLAATRVDVNGLIEKGRENLLTESNNFSDSDWSKSTNITLTSGQTGYDGSSDAWEYDLSTSGAFKAISQAISHSGVHTMSVYAKANTITKMSLRSLSGTDAIVIFDLSNGTMVVGANAIEGKMVDVGSGWYRCSMIYNGSSQTTNYIYLNDISTATSGSIYIQDAQLEQGLVATDYIETTTTSVSAGILEDMPRLDYSGSCPSLLLEPQRTNKITQSEYFQSGWVDNGNISYDFGYLAPDGTNSAYKITGNDNGYISFAGVLNNDTRSVYARTTSGTGTLQLLTYFGNTNNTFTITEEWQRFDISSVTTSTGEANFYLADFRGSSSLDEVILWGAQCEAGSYPTSYIPTYGTSQTRSADNNNAPFVDIETEGTMFGEVEVVSTGVFGTPMALSIDNATTNFVLIYKTDINRLSARIRFGGADQCLIDSGTLTEGYHKFAFRYRENDCEFFVDGVSVGTDTSVSIPTGLNVIRQYIGASINAFVGGTKQLAYFPTALTDSECIALTTI